MPTSGFEPKGPREAAKGLERGLGRGRALDAPVRERMERGFGRSLEHVRLHDGPSAAGAADGLGARAFALGDHVVFGAGAYKPGTPAGDSLLAHELAHTLQRAPGPTRLVSRPGDTAEREAAGAATQLRHGRRPALKASRAAFVHRQPVEGAPPEDEAWTAPELPPPGGETLEVGGVTLSADAAYARAQLERYYAAHGREATDRLVAAVRSHASTLAAGVPTPEANERLRGDLGRYGPGDVSGVPLSDEQLTQARAPVTAAAAIAGAAERQWVLLRGELDALLPRFQRTGEDIVRLLLGESEAQINGERSRYGITEESHWEETGRERGQVMRRVTTYSHGVQPREHRPRGGRSRPRHAPEPDRPAADRADEPHAAAGQTGRSRRL